MIRRPPRSTRKESSAASDVYKRQRKDSPSHRMVHGSVFLQGLRQRKACVSRPSRTAWGHSSAFVFWLLKCHGAGAKPSAEIPPHSGMSLSMGVLLDVTLTTCQLGKVAFCVLPPHMGHPSPTIVVPVDVCSWRHGQHHPVQGHAPSGCLFMLKEKTLPSL